MSSDHQPAAQPSGWFKSSFSDHGGGCVEVRFEPSHTLVRDSKYLRNPTNDPAAQPIIQIPADSWTEFLDTATRTATRSDTYASDRIPAIDRTSGIGALIRSADGITLDFTAAEWDAFTAGIHAGEFARAPHTSL